MKNVFNSKPKLIALIAGVILAIGGVAFGFKDAFLSDKNLYLKIEASNIKMLAEKVEDIKDEDLLGMFFADNSNKSTTTTDVSLNISANGLAEKVATFFNSLKISIKDEVIQRDDYKNKEIKFLYNQDELITANVVDDEDFVGVSVPKLYDKWVVTDMGLAKLISEIAKSDEATGMTNTMTLSAVKSVFTLSKTEKEDLENNLKYYKDKFVKTIADVEFTKTLDATFTYDGKEMISDSMMLQLSEVETLARTRQMLSKLKESGQLLDWLYDKVAEIKATYGENNIITDKIPDKKEALDQINELLNEIDARLADLKITDISLLFDKDDKYIAPEGLIDNKYTMVIYFDNDYKILKREIYTEKLDDEADHETAYEIVAVENDDERFYMFKRPDEIIKDRVDINGSVTTHNIFKAYNKETYAFEGFKIVKTEKWIDDEELITLEIDSSNQNQKIITVQIPGINIFKLFADIQRIEQGKNEIKVITKIGLDIKGEKQYCTLNKVVTKKSDISKMDIHTNAINISEQTAEKVEIITQAVKGNTEALSNSIKEKTGIDLSDFFKKAKEYPTKIMDTYESLSSLGII